MTLKTKLIRLFKDAVSSLDFHIASNNQIIDE
jgi:hypothetical protein